MRLANWLVVAAGPVLAWSCASAPAPEETPAPQAFELTGSRIIGCCCAAPCPCRINAKPMHCHGCDHSDAVHVESGHIGDTDMSGVSWVIVGRVFGESTDGNWTYVYVDDEASDAQLAALTGMLTSDVESLGPKAEHLAGKFLGMRRVPMTYAVSADGRDYDCIVPGILELRTRAHVNPGRSQPVVSTGILDAFGDRFVHADTLAHTYRDDTLGYAWDLTGRQSNQAEFVLTEERAKEGGIGWGCWTANSELGDTGEYQERMLGH